MMIWLWIMALGAPENDRLSLDTSLGDDTFFWGAGTTLAVADNGTLFVLDPSAFKVKIFNKDFQQIGDFGGRGKGPGEFEEPKIITRTPDGNLGVFDPTLKRLTIFDAQGNVLRTPRLDASSVAVYHPVVLREDRTGFLSARAHKGKPVYDLSLFDAKAKEIRNLMRFPVKPLDWSQSNNPHFWVSFLINELTLLEVGLPVMCALDADTVVYAKSDDYNLTFIDASGKQLQQIKHSLKPMALSPGARDAAFEAVWTRLTVDPFLFNNMPRNILERAASKVEGPAVLPAVKAMTPFGKGLAVLVQYNEQKHTGRLDILDRKGKLISSHSYKGPANFITGCTNERLYTVGPNEEGDIIIARYHLQ